MVQAVLWGRCRFMISLNYLGAVSSAFVIACGLLWLSVKRPLSRALLYWALAHAAFGLTGILYGFHLTSPGLPLMAVTNASYILFFYLMLVGTLIFTERPLSLKFVVVSFVSLETFQITVALTLPRPAPHVISSVIGAALLLYTAFAFFRRQQSQNGVGYGFVGGIMGLRALNTLAFPWLVQTAFVEYVYLASQIFVVLSGIGLIIIEQQEALRALRQREAELQETEIKLRDAKERAEHANTAKSRFLAAASHDLRQPLQAQMLFHALLVQQSRDPALAAILAKLGQSLAAQQQMLNALLDISRLEAGVVEVERIDFPIGPLLDRLAHEFDLQAKTHGLNLRTVGCTAIVHSDPNLLERILRNLLDNAIKYTDDGRILLGCRRTGRSLRLQVWDTGCGIPEDQLTVIFEEFHQLGNPARDRSLGLGLGLAIVERLVKLLGCRITVRSAVGKGSVFEIAEMPLARAPPPQELKDRKAGLRGTRRAGLIAVIEDDAQLLEALQLSLEAIGYEVVVAGTIAEAVARCREQPRPPRVIVADYRLGQGRTGTEAIGRLRSEFGAGIAGILLTGDTSPDRLRDAKRSGLHLLHKPIRPEDLAQVIEQAMARSC